MSKRIRIAKRGGDPNAAPELSNIHKTVTQTEGVRQETYTTPPSHQVREQLPNNQMVIKNHQEFVNSRWLKLQTREPDVNSPGMKNFIFGPTNFIDHQQGFFELELEPRKYSVFVKEKGKLYANWGDGQGGLCPVLVESSKVSEINLILDYACY